MAPIKFMMIYLYMHSNYPVASQEFLHLKHTVIM